MSNIGQILTVDLGDSTILWLLQLAPNNLGHKGIYDIASVAALSWHPHLSFTKCLVFA